MEQSGGKEVPLPARKRIDERSDETSPKWNGKNDQLNTERRCREDL